MTVIPIGAERCEKHGVVLCGPCEWEKEAGLFWIIVNAGRADWKFTKAEAPCWKGEIVLPLFSWHLVIGWQSVGKER